jgi:hypothetical protein
MISDQWHPQNAHTPSSVAYQSPTVAKLPPPAGSAFPAAIDSHPEATQPFHHNGHLEKAMLKGLIPPAPIILHPEMEGYVARFQNLHGSEEALVDSQLPGAWRLNINLFGMGVVEQSNIPELRPNIPLPTLGFNHGTIQYDPGNGASLHSLTTEEVFMPLIGPRAVTWLNDDGEQEIILQPFDSIYVSLCFSRPLSRLSPCLRRAQHASGTDRRPGYGSSKPGARRFGARGGAGPLSQF